jgi:hypothetical protein
VSPLRLVLAAVVAAPLVASCSSEGAPDPGAGGGTGPEANCPGAGAGAPSLAAVRGCLGQGVRAAACLEPLFHEHLKTHTTVEALALLTCYGHIDVGVREACHPVSHAIGRETMVLTKTIDAAFAACDLTCQSGCYHGAMERFLRGEADDAEHISLAEVQKKAVGACNPALPMRLRFQCLHGLGHAVDYYTGYQLRPSLKVCDAVSDDGWTRTSCYGGVFMENIVAVEPSKRDVSPTDYHYPCSAVDAQYKSECYVMQTSRMTEMGLPPPRIFEECRTAGEYRYACLQSLGRDLSNGARVGKPREVSALCELGKDEELRSCTRGVVYPLVDATGDAEFAFPYCATYPAADASLFCFQTAVGYLVDLFGRSVPDVAQQCQKLVPGNAACAEAARR